MVVENINKIHFYETLDTPSSSVACFETSGQNLNGILLIECLSTLFLHKFIIVVSDAFGRQTARDLL